jgi:hypothetical protein
MCYICKRCGYSHKKKDNMFKHFNRKNVCKPNICDISIEECIKVLEDKKVLSEVDNLKEENKLLKLSLKTIQDQMSELIKRVGNNNNNTNNNITINVNSFDKTDYTVLKDKIHTCIKDGKVDESKLIKMLHFNKDAPQNHNVKISSKRENRIQLYNGENFEESNYKGKKGVWTFGQDALKNTEKNGLVDDEELLSIEDPDTNVIPLEEKRERTNKIETVLHNGFLIN